VIATPRQRVLAAVHGEEVLPVPYDVMENQIHPLLERSLARHFGLHQTDHLGVLHKLGAHLRWGRPAYVGPPLAEAPVQPPDPWPSKRATRNIWGGWSGMNTYSDTIERPLAHVETIAEIEAYPWRVANVLTQRLKILTLGTGSGSGCDGQGLMTQDLWSLPQPVKPRLAKQYDDLFSMGLDAMTRFKQELTERHFPPEPQTARMSDDETKRFLDTIG
jgi:hypothetical protein